MNNLDAFNKILTEAGLKTIKTVPSQKSSKTLQNMYNKFLAQLQLVNELALPEVTYEPALIYGTLLRIFQDGTHHKYGYWSILYTDCLQIKARVCWT